MKRRVTKWLPRIQEPLFVRFLAFRLRHRSLDARESGVDAGLYQGGNRIVEFEDVDERIEWEAKRVAAAFGVKRFTREASQSGIHSWSGRVGPNTVRWTLSQNYEPIALVQIGKGRRRCTVLVLIGGGWGCVPESSFNELMARGLYRLGFEDESVLCQLPALSAHEKLELRLSLPREFWPKTWLGEEAK